jgi:excisionase family DNA binding protein
MRAADVVADGVMTVDDAGTMLAVSRSTVYALMDRGELAYVQIGRARRVPKRAVAVLLERNLKGGWLK